MATRVFFPDGVTAPVTPPAPVGSTEWEHINGSGNIDQALLLVADSSALATVAYTPDAADHLTNNDSNHRQYVSQPLKAQTISGNIKAQFQCLEALANCNLFLTLKLLVCNNDGSSTLATLLAITRDTTNELATSLTNRNFPSTALTSYGCADGDRIVIEVGLGGNITSGTGGTVGHNGSIRWGCNASSGDLPEDDTQTGTTYRAWLEFANTIQWLSEADADSDGLGASSVVGAALWLSDIASAGVGASSVVGAMVAASVIASDGVASSSVETDTIIAGDGTSSGTATVSADGEDAGAGGLTEADGAASGAASSSVIAASIFSGLTVSDGLAAGAAVGVGTAETTGSSAGVGASNVAGATMAATDGQAAGSTTSAAVGSALSLTVANANGSSTGNGATGGAEETDGTAAGSATVQGQGAMVLSSEAQAAGVTTPGVTSAAMWASFWASSAVATAESIAAGVATSVGGSLGQGVVTGEGTDGSLLGLTTLIPVVLHLTPQLQWAMEMDRQTTPDYVLDELGMPILAEGGGYILAEQQRRDRSQISRIAEIREQITSVLHV